ncbi:MAG: enoyl-CoA hydratase/isomerase family protein [Caulobacteraceae bacterium]|nr:enoyl-CoA hydratase/isomerase family protein [Caulobacteraceae bacterium]
MGLRDRYGDAALSLDGHVAVLEFSRPPNNHVSVELLKDLADAFDHLDAETQCRAIVLASAGKVFCAGADLAAEEAEEGRTFNPLYVQATRLFANKKPIVCAVQGAAVGAGLGLSLIADFRVAAPEARFSANFVKIGFHPGFGITYVLPRLIGEQKAALMMLSGRRVKAEDALAWGLVDVVAPLEQVREEAIALAREIAENAPLAVQSTRATLRKGLSQAVKTRTDYEFTEQEWLRVTRDYAEGLKAVAERRPGLFVNA